MGSSGFYLIDSDFNVLHSNDTAKRIYPQLEIGKKCYACLMNLDSPCGPCPVVKGIKGPRTYVDPIRHITESVDAVDVPLEGHGLCHALVFSTVDDDAVFAATLPKTAEDLRNLALIQALTVDFTDVFSVRLSDGLTTLYRHNGQAADAHGSEPPLYYEDATEKYISKYVYEEDRESFRRQSSLAYLTQELQHIESIVAHYRVIYNGELHYYSRKVARIGTGEHFDYLVIGTANEDKAVIEKMKERDLEKNLNSVEYDSLTGLYTKEAFMIHGEKLLSRQASTDYDLCVLKLENLGLINHQYGTLTGDKVLSLIGRLLKAYITETNCIAYMGNGTFCSLTETTGSDYRKNTIMKFRHDIFEQSEIKTLSPKWSLYKKMERNSPISEIYEKTVYALSTIRSSIHEDYVEFDQQMFEQMERDAAIEKSFEEALTGGEFICHYQPKFSARDQSIVGAEALVRWVKKDGTMISPAEFIPVLEKTGRINRLDTYVFEQVCLLQRRLQEQGINSLPISVNLSRASLFTENLAEIYHKTALQQEIDAKTVPIEITESAAVRATAIKSFADDLIHNGFVLHMDDFGSGYSSLASLNVIPFESIKMDKSLVDFIGRDSNESLLRHVISYAHEQGKTVVAEGVETYEQYLFLKFNGCDAIQGFYFSKPVCEADFLSLLNTQMVQG